MHASVSLTTGQWHECRHSCHWPVVNDTDACIRVIDHGQWHLWMHSCHWPPVNDIFECIRVIDHQSMTPVKAFVSLTTSQWHLWMHLCHWPLFNDENALSVMSYMHSCHWPNCIRVIDHSLRKDDCPCLERPHHAFVSLTTGQWHECTEFDLNQAVCIRVIDQCAFVSLTNVHSCHWPICIRVIDQCAFVSLTNVHSCHWPPSVTYIQQCAFVSLTTP